MNDVAGKTCVTLTPNRRLARLAREAHAARALAAGQRVWETPAIFPWDAWLHDLWEQGRPLRCARGDSPRLLSRLACAALWEQVIEQSELLDPLLPPARLVPEVMAAWAQLHAFGGDPAVVLAHPPTPAVASFARWSQSYRRRCQQAHWFDPSELPHLLAADPDVLAATVPGELVLLGFDRFLPQQDALLSAIAAKGCALRQAAPPPTPAAPELRTYADAQDELRAAAAWAGQIARDSARQRIAVVFPDLGSRRAEIVRAFTAALAPQELLSPWNETQAAFEISLGEPLAQHPLVAPALALLAWAGRDAPLADVFATLRSPYFAANPSVQAELGLLEREFLELGSPRLTPEVFLKRGRGRAELVPSMTVMQRWLERVAQAPARQGVSAWRRQWEEELVLWAWPAGVPLTSSAFQAQQAWQALLDDWLSVEAVLGPVQRDTALKSLRAATAERLFQPEGKGARVLVLGALEAAGLEVDALWVCGLTTQLWPRDARPSPYLPLDWQKAAGIAAASSEGAMSEAQVRLSAYLARAGEAVFSRPSHCGEEQLAPSALLAAFAAVPAVEGEALGDPVTAGIVTLSHLEPRPVEQGLPVTSQARASAYALNAQAACPYQAYGRYRLCAEAWPQISLGLSAREQGTLLHEALAHLWAALQSQARLLALDEAQLFRHVLFAVEHAQNKLPASRWQALPDFVRAIEAQRLKQLLVAALDMEKQRPVFTRVSGEVKTRFELSGLPLSLRPDRHDQIADGRSLIIDYKTGAAPPTAAWLEAPPRELQLPLYALAYADQNVAGIVVLRLAEGACKAYGLVADERVWPDLKTIAQAGKGHSLGDWSDLLAFWRQQLSALAADYAAGHAPLRPRDAKVCSQCDLSALCRIAEYAPAGSIETPEEEGDD